jgi:hypothetical protein
MLIKVISKPEIVRRIQNQYLIKDKKQNLSSYKVFYKKNISLCYSCIEFAKWITSKVLIIQYSPKISTYREPIGALWLVVLIELKVHFNF